MVKDQRYTCLAGIKTKKSAEILELLGDLDELNCLLGLAKVFSSVKPVTSRLDELQDDLFQVSGRVAGAKVEFDFEVKTRLLEEEIQKRRDPELKKFVKPGKNKVSAFLHLARAVCRRAERRAVRLGGKYLGGENLGGGRERSETGSCEVVGLVGYLNCFSGLLFWLAV